MLSVSFLHQRFPPEVLLCDGTSLWPRLTEISVANIKPLCRVRALISKCVCLLIMPKRVPTTSDFGAKHTHLPSEAWHRSPLTPGTPRRRALLNMDGDPGSASGHTAVVQNCSGEEGGTPKKKYFRYWSISYRLRGCKRNWIERTVCREILNNHQVKVTFWAFNPLQRLCCLHPRPSHLSLKKSRTLHLLSVTICSITLTFRSPLGDKANSIP